MSKVSMNALEQAVMDKLLWGDDVLLSELRDQFAKATVKEREITGAGFYLTFLLPENSSKLTDQIPNVKPNFCFGDVNAEIENLENGVGFLIWVKDGKLSMLEGYSYHGIWPETIGKFHLSYFLEPRDISELWKQWLTPTPIELSGTDNAQAKQN
jgi:hypothetical protein